MISKVDANGDGSIDRNEFQTLIMPILLNEIVAADEAAEHYRSIFLQADLDYSGFLSVDELFSVLLNQGVDINRQELVDLLIDFDHDGDAKLDIDEFVALMTSG